MDLVLSISYWSPGLAKKLQPRAQVFLEDVRPKFFEAARSLAEFAGKNPLRPGQFAVPNQLRARLKNCTVAFAALLEVSPHDICRNHFPLVKWAPSMCMSTAACASAAAVACESRAVDYSVPVAVACG